MLVVDSVALALAALPVASAGTLTCIPPFYTLAPAMLSGPAAIGLRYVNPPAPAEGPGA